MNEIVLRKPDDFHVHLRQGELMPHLVREAAKVFQRVLVMPNTLPPIVVPENLKAYEDKLKSVGTGLGFLMTFKIFEGLDNTMLTGLKNVGAIAGKLYPQGVTTNSEDGITDIEKLFPVFSAMQELDVVLCLHGEVPEIEDLKREQAFLPMLKKIHQNFPKLRIVLEHVSSKDGVEVVKELGETVAATITVHHLLLTTADVRNGYFHPHNFCAPICKSDADRKALIEATTSGNPKFFFGSDSAPHLVKDKQGEHSKPGIFTTPVALPLLAQIFEEQGRLERLEAFTSQFGAEFYQLPLNTGLITLKKKSWQVPGEYFGVVPLRAGEKVSWKQLG
jgi:dihydroorotase